MAARRHDDDDGHVIVDMSALRGRPKGFARTRRDVADELHDAEERRMVVLGTLKAALALGMVYVVVFGIAIALMVWLWT